MLLQLADDGRHVDKLDLRRPHFGLDPVQLPCPILETIGHAVSSGCFRLDNADVIDLYARVQVGAKVLVRQSAHVS